MIASTVRTCRTGPAAFSHMGCQPTVADKEGDPVQLNDLHT